MFRYLPRLALSLAVLWTMLPAAVTIDADHPLIQYSGRCDFTDPKAVRFEWTGVYISASFTGSSIGVRLDDGANDYNVFIDGAGQNVLITQSGLRTYTVASGLSAGTHTILLTKRTESYGNVVTFRGFELADGGQLVASAPKPDRRIQFIGDSFTSGLGGESDGVDCNSRTFTNSYKAFSAVTACSLQAEYHILSRSGTGLVRNYGYPGTSDPNAYPSIYGRLFPSHTQAFDSTSWVPHLVVICLGLNDFTSQPNPTADQWKAGLLALVNRVRIAAPGTAILCVGERFEPQIGYTRDVVMAERNAGRLDIYYCNFMNVGTYVCDHPHVSEHYRIAGLIVRAVTQYLGWTSGPTGTLTTKSCVSPVMTAAAPRLLIGPIGLSLQRGDNHIDLRGRTQRTSTPTIAELYRP
jgi:lysophospholipase L1-like esterase